MSEVSFLLPRPYPTMHSVHNHNRDLLHEIPTPSKEASYSFISQTLSAGRMLSSCYASDFQSAVVDRPAPALRQPEWKKKKVAAMEFASTVKGHRLSPLHVQNPLNYCFGSRYAIQLH